jgi:hypothetical protein
MKKLFTIFACASFAFTLSAQDSSQPAGSWYLGGGDATSLLNIFSTGVDLSPSVGYAVADDIVVSAMLSGPTSAMDLALNAKYFKGDYFVGASAYDVAGDNLDIGIQAGYYIDFKDVLYLTPQFDYIFGLPEGSSDYVNIGIGFGARF